MIPVVIVLFLVGAGLFLWLTFFSGFFNKEEMIEVPPLIGQTLEEVLADPDVTDHFKVVQETTKYSDEYEEGEIISQNPDPGSQAKEGSIIKVVICGGQEPIEMVDVENMRYEDAVSRLEGMQLKVDQPEQKPSEEIEKGRVISFNPPVGTKLQPGDTIHLVVSTGPEVKKVMVPSVVGQSLENARTMLSAVKLTVANVVEVDSDQPKGKVTYQSVAGGTEVDEGTAVTLNVSKGPSAPAEQPPQRCSTEIQLPTDRDSVTVQVTVNGAEQYNTTVNTATGSFYAPITGSGVQEVCVYFDGQFAERYNFNFNENKRV